MLSIVGASTAEAHNGTAICSRRTCIFLFLKRFICVLCSTVEQLEEGLSNVAYSFLHAIKGLQAFKDVHVCVIKNIHLF